MAGLRRRGVPPEAIRDFVQRIGVAKANSVVDVTAVRHCSWLRVTIASLAYSHTRFRSLASRRLGTISGRIHPGAILFLPCNVSRLRPFLWLLLSILEGQPWLSCAAAPS